MSQEENIFPVHDKLLQRSDKETLLNQKAKVVWLTGLSGSGKTTLAKNLERSLHEKGYLITVLDGDNVRDGISYKLGFSEEDRLENIRRVAEVSKLFLTNGIICINSFISPSIEIRSLAKKIIGANDFIEIYVNSSLEVCESRDTKGLYKKAREGKILNFTGVNALFEEPTAPQLEIRTDQLEPDESLKKLEEYLIPLIRLNPT